jgi:hypothetical protein
VRRRDPSGTRSRPGLGAPGLQGEIGDEGGDRREELAGACGRRRAVAPGPAVSKRELESLELRRERLEPKRRTGPAQAVGLVGRGRNRRRPLRGKAAPVERVEMELDALHPARGVEQEDGSQLVKSGFGQETQDNPSSWATATASARRFTPSFS